MAAGLLQLAGPLDVGLLVEARLDLDQDQYLLAGLGGVDQRVHDRRVAGGAVQRLLDRQHVGVGGGLVEERLHGGGEGVVRVVQQHVALAQRREDVRRRCADSTSARSRWVPATKLGVLQLGPVQPGDREQAGQVQRPGQRVHLGVLHLQLVDEQVEHPRGDRLLDLQPHRRAEAAPHELLLQRLEQVLRVVLLDLQVLVAGDPEHVVVEHLHAGEQLLQVRGDDVLQGDVALRARLQEARQDRRHLHPGEVLVAGDRVADDDGQVERQARRCTGRGARGRRPAG